MRRKLFASCTLAVTMSALSVIAGGTPTCHPPPPPSNCWETGGGTFGEDPGQPDYSFGGVVNPGCSATAAGGGNLNVVDHLLGRHFKGLEIVVTSCGGEPTKSPKVNVNVINFVGIGTLTDDTTGETIAVAFDGTFTDNHDGGAGADHLTLDVGAGALTIDDDLATGNIQIHTSSCDKK